MKNEKIKLNLNDLKVDSFVTSIDKNDSITVKGGAFTTAGCVLSIVITVTITSSTYSYTCETEHNHC